MKRDAVALLALILFGLLAAGATADERGTRGVLAVQVGGAGAAARGRVLAEERSRQLFTPASVTKLVVAAAALHHLGPAHRIRTLVAATAPPREGVVDGDLVVRAAGDPTWSRRFHPDEPRAPLRALAGAVAAQGVRRVSGDLVVDVSRFPGRALPGSRPDAERAYSWAAPPAACAVDEAIVRIAIAPGPHPGAPIEARPADAASADLVIDNRAVTVGRARHGKGSVDVLPRWGEPRLLVRGEYPISEPPYTLELSAPDAELRAGRALVVALAEHGVEVAGRVRLSRRPIATALELARVSSPPIAELLPAILTDSSNWHADMLLRLLAAEHVGSGRLRDGLDLERRLLEGVVGVDAEAFFFEDAAGLSPYDLIAPEAVVALLRWAWRQPWRDVFVEALARPGTGSLEGWPAMPPVAAKTGTLRHAVALAGYLRPAGPEPVAFCIFLDRRLTSRPSEPDLPSGRPALRQEIAEILRRLDDLAKLR